MQGHLFTAAIALFTAGSLFAQATPLNATQPPAATIGPAPQLAKPKKQAIPTVHIAPAKGWQDGARPVAAAGLSVAPLATGLDHPRWIYVLPNGDVLVAESNAPPKPEGSSGGIKGKVMGLVMKRAGAGVPSANRITLLRDADGDGMVELRTTFLQGLNSPFGMALVGNTFYVANADAIVSFPYQPGQSQITAQPTKVFDLPAGINHHWTKNLMASADGRKLYATVGSNSNVAENGMSMEEGRAAIWEFDIASGKGRLFATGLRNPNGLAWAGGKLWTVVNERDELGDDLVPDYLTSVADGAFYGWPYSYYGQNVDTRVKPPMPELVARAVKPDYSLGSHVAPLGLASSDGAALPAPFNAGFFIGQHGSWNRKPRTGYNVVFVPYDGKGNPSAQPVVVLGGFVSDKGDAWGRPVGVAIDKRGALLVADDVGNVIWRVTAAQR
ncbi:MAG: sorbosone dehydrogenase family protein [Pseudomonadota bacterium]